jgi:hypothetical protein
MKMEIKELLSAAKAYSKENDIKLSTMGLILVGNSTFFQRLANKGDCNTKTYNNVMAAFNDDIIWDKLYRIHLKKSKLNRENRKLKKGKKS